MKTNLNIPHLVESFFKNYSIDEKLNNYSFFLIRDDGVILYHNDRLLNPSERSSVGALLAGVWQAAHALAKFVPEKDLSEGHRLSFDTSSQGVYVLPIKTLRKEEFYLGLIYHNEVNPGFIKSKIREVALSFSEFLERELKNVHPENQAVLKEKKDSLFGDITDSEMDRLFTFTKN